MKAINQSHLMYPLETMIVMVSHRYFSLDQETNKVPSPEPIKKICYTTNKYEVQRVDTL